MVVKKMSKNVSKKRKTTIKKLHKNSRIVGKFMYNEWDAQNTRHYTLE